MKKFILTFVLFFALGILLARWSLPFPFTSVPFTKASISNPDILCAQYIVSKNIFGWPFMVVHSFGTNSCNARGLLSIGGLMVNLFLCYRLVYHFTKTRKSL